MIASRRFIRACLFAVVFSAPALIGCGGETSAPTKIYEGGGTIPEIVDQPETPEKGQPKAK
ncbi:MAG: hypothetical protein SFX72_16630 [Isosphaeraceae bacterium]|nr:hypothetical protein [Isosphaeraceae bacterium]